MNNETWIIERGAAVIERKVSDGDVPLTPLEGEKVGAQTRSESKLNIDEHITT